MNYEALFTGGKSHLVYTPNYCEENIWKLAEFVQTEKNEVVADDELYVVFISNKNKSVPIWYQLKCENEHVPVVWDYHVIAIHKDSKSQKSYVYDLDTVLDFPCPFDVYLNEALVELPNIKSIYKRNYRVVTAKYYLSQFASDRSHMIDPEKGTYLQSPPSYPPIQTSNCTNNINEFIDMELSESVDELSDKHGTVMSESRFAQFF